MAEQPGDTDLPCDKFTYGSTGNLNTIEWESECDSSPTDENSYFQFKYSSGTDLMSKWWDPVNSGGSQDPTGLSTNITYAALWASTSSRR